MPKKPLEAIEEHFGKVSDPRKDRTKDHKLIDIIAIAICAIICGAEGWTDMEVLGTVRWSGSKPSWSCRMEYHRMIPLGEFLA